MSRLRNRPDRFNWKGDDYAFHRLQDGPTLARLDPYSDVPQRWLLHSGKVLHLTGADVRSVAKQVNGTDLPETRPEGIMFQTDPRIEAMLKRIEDLELQLDMLADRMDEAIHRIGELEARPAVIERIVEPAPLPEPEPIIEEPEIAPADHFADLMLADETADDAKARLSARFRDLRHFLMAPGLKVNDDQSLGLTEAEQLELQDLERRQAKGRWLDA